MYWKPEREIVQRFAFLDPVLCLSFLHSVLTYSLSVFSVKEVVFAYILCVDMFLKAVGVGGSGTRSNELMEMLKEKFV